MEDLSRFNQFGKGAERTPDKATSKNAVIYTRVSTKEQAETNKSLPTQKKYCLEHAQRNKLLVLEEFGGTYESAASDERREFKRMLAFIKRSKEKVSYIIVYSLDRFSRTGEGAISITSELRRRGIQVISATQPAADTNTPTGKLQQNIQLIFGQYDNDQRRMKSINGMVERLRRGDWSGLAPLGYDNITINGEKKIEINKKGEIVRKMFHWKVYDGLTNTQVVEKCAALGFNINPKRLTEIFRNPFYCGMISHKLLNGEVIRGNHEPLVSEEIFFRANELVSQHRHDYTVQINNENLPMKGFVRCSQCYGPMTGYTNKKKQLHYYKCNSKGCSNNVNVQICHKKFTDQLASFIVDPELIPALKEQLKRTFQYMNQQNTGLENELLSQQRDIQKRIDTIGERFALGEIDNAMYDQFNSKYQLELSQVLAELEKIEAKISNLSKYIDFSISISQNINDLWQKSTYVMKQKLQYLAFPEGILYDKKNNTYLTDRVNAVFTTIATFSGSNDTNENKQRSINAPLSDLVPGTGVEPVRPQRPQDFKSCVSTSSTTQAWNVFD